MIESELQRRYVGIMQGRLTAPEAGGFRSFPLAHWRDEFSRASEAGLDSIEWIYDAYGASGNPIASDSGTAEMRALGERYGIAVLSICANYFMDCPIVRAPESELPDIVSRLYWLIERARRLGAERIVLPFVDASSMRDAADEQHVLAILEDVFPFADRSHIELHLEADFEPERFAAFLQRIDRPGIKVNYDSGNSASLGYRPRDEFAAYGPKIGSVHIKDRLRGGGTVPLGTGDADLTAVFRELGELGYRGDYILEAARGRPGSEVELAAQNRLFVLRGIADARVDPSMRAP